MFKLNKVNFDLHDLHEFVDFSALKLKQYEINNNFHDFKSFLRSLLNFRTPILKITSNLNK